LIYNYYNIDPQWHANEEVNRILLLEPSFFQKYPISEKCLKFCIDLSKNIKGMQIFCGEFDALHKVAKNSEIIFKEHPMNGHYIGKATPVAYLSSAKGEFKSFFDFWKKSKKDLEY
jgi:deoxyribodipyrimidine photo-lyase